MSGLLFFYKVDQNKETPIQSFCTATNRRCWFRWFQSVRRCR